jgi:hypothetical protein
LNNRAGGASRWFTLGKGNVAFTMTRWRFRRLQLAVRTAEKRKRAGCINLL